VRTAKTLVALASIVLLPVRFAALTISVRVTGCAFTCLNDEGCVRAKQSQKKRRKTSRRETDTEADRETDKGVEIGGESQQEVARWQKTMHSHEPRSTGTNPAAQPRRHEPRSTATNPAAQPHRHEPRSTGTQARTR
jgi:hypothetical protein